MCTKNSNQIMSALGSQEILIDNLWSELSDLEKEMKTNENKLKFILHLEQFLKMDESEAIATLEKEKFLKVDGTFNHLFNLSVRECSSDSVKVLETTLSEQKKKMSEIEAWLKEARREYEEVSDSDSDEEVSDSDSDEEVSDSDSDEEVSKDYHDLTFYVIELWPEKISKSQQKIKMTEDKLKFILNLEQFLKMDESEAIATLEKEKFLKVDDTFNHLFNLSVRECSSDSVKALETILSEQKEKLLDFEKWKAEDAAKLIKMDEKVVLSY